MHRLPRLPFRLQGLGDMGRVAAARAVTRKAIQSIRLHGLGDTCTIDPTTGGRVCTSGPGTATTTVAAAPTPIPFTGCNGTVTPRYLTDPTTQQWDWNNPTPASWIFQGWVDANSPYDIYVRQDGGAFAAVGPGGGFAYNDPRRATIAAYSACPGTVAATPVATTPTYIDPATGLPTTIQPIAAAPALPAPMVATAAPAMVPISGGSTNWTKYALYGGGILVGLMLVKKFLK